MQKYTVQNLEQLSKADLIAIILAQQEIIEKLEYRVSCLEKNSGNSSKPPSTDFSKPVKRTQSLRQKSGRRSGGQPGHAGVTRTQVENPDKIVVLKPDRCGGCGSDLTDLAGELYAKRQVVDLPPIIPIYTEYQAMAITCKCGFCTKAIFPDWIKAPIQIGPIFKSFVGYLSSVHVIPYDRLTQIADDLLHFRISEGTVDNIIKEIATKGEPVRQSIANLVRSHKWTGGDETGVKVEGKRWWKWVWQNVLGSYYAVSQSRGYGVVKEYFGENYLGAMIHDCWGAQLQTVAQLGHQLCHAHLLRNLWFGVESEGSRWAYQMIRFLQKTERARAVIWEEGRGDRFRGEIIRGYELELAALLEQNLNKKEELKLQKRLRKHQDKILFFMNSPDIPYENNSSEQAIRQAKVKQKVSGGFRSREGAQRYAIILSIVETCKKQRLNVLESIQKVILGQPLAFQ